MRKALEGVEGCKMSSKQRDSVEEEDKRLKLVTPKRNWKRHESVIQRRYKGRRDALLRTSRRSEYKVYKPIELEAPLTHETALNKSTNVLGWLESMIKRGRSALSTLKEDEKAFDVELQNEARHTLAHEKLLRSALYEPLEAPDSSAANGYGTDTSFKNFNSTLRNSLADSMDEVDLNEALYANGSEMEVLESGDNHFAPPLDNRSISASSFAVLQDEEDGGSVKEWNSASEASFDATERQPRDGAHGRNEDVVEILSSEDENNPSIDYEDQGSQEEEWEDKDDLDSEEEELRDDILVHNEEPTDQEYIGESQTGARDSDVEYQSVSSADNSSMEEYDMDHLEIGEHKELLNQGEEYDEEEELKEFSIRTADQSPPISDELGEQKKSSGGSPSSDQGVLSKDANGFAENVPDVEQSIAMAETYCDKQSQINVGDPNGSPSVMEDASTVKEVSDLPIPTGKFEEHVESYAISQVSEDESHAPTELSEDSDAHQEHLDEDICDYKAIANAVMNQPSLASDSLCQENNIEVETTNEEANMGRDKKTSTSISMQIGLKDELEHNVINSSHTSIEAFAATFITGTKDENEDNSGHQQFSTDVYQESSSSFQEEPTIYHSFVAEQTEVESVYPTSQKNTELDTGFKLVFTGSAYSSSSFSESENVPEGESEYVSPLAEDPFLSVGVEQNKDLLQRTLAALEEKSGSTKASVDVTSHPTGEDNRTYKFSEEGIRSTPRAPNEAFKDQDGKDRGSSIMREDYATYPGDMKLPDGLQTRESSVTYLSNAVAARDETISVVHNKSVSQYNGYALPLREELGNLGHLKDEEISEYLSAVLEASGRIEDGVNLENSSKNHYVEEVQFPDIETNSLIQTEPVVELNDTSVGKLSGMAISQESYQNELIVVEEINEYNGVATSSVAEAVEIIQTTPIIEEPFTSCEIWPNGSTGETRSDVQEVHLNDEPSFVDLRKRTYSMLDDDASAIETLEGRRLSTTEWFAKVSNNSIDAHSNKIERQECTPPSEAVELNRSEQFADNYGTLSQNDENNAVNSPPKRRTSTFLGHITSGLLPKKLISSPVRAISSIVTGMKEVGTVASCFVRSLDVVDLDDDTNTQPKSGELDEFDDDSSLHNKKSDDTYENHHPLENKIPDSPDVKNAESAKGSDVPETEGFSYLVEDVKVVSDTSEADSATSSVIDETVMRERLQQNPLAESDTIHESQTEVSSAAINHRLSASDLIDNHESEHYLESALASQSFDVKGIQQEQVSNLNLHGIHINSFSGDKISNGSPKSCIANEEGDQEDTIYVEKETSSESDQNFVAPGEPPEPPNAKVSERLTNEKGLNTLAQVTSRAENGFEPERNEVLSNVLALQELAEKLRTIHSVHSDADESGSVLPPDDSEGAVAPVNVEIDPETHIEVDQGSNEIFGADEGTIKEEGTFPIESTLILESQLLREGKLDEPKSRQGESLASGETALANLDTASTNTCAIRTLPANLPSDPPSDNSEDHSQSEQDSAINAKLTREMEAKTEESRPTPEYCVLDTTSDEGDGREIPVDFESKPAKAVSVTVEDKDPVSSGVHPDMDIKLPPSQSDSIAPSQGHMNREKASFTLLPASDNKDFEDKDSKNKKEGLSERQMARKRDNKRSRIKRKAKLKASRANKKLNQGKSQRNRK